MNGTVMNSIIFGSFELKKGDVGGDTCDTFVIIQLHDKENVREYHTKSSVLWPVFGFESWSSLE
jgi:hypothetical protein